MCADVVFFLSHVVFHRFLAEWKNLEDFEGKLTLVVACATTVDDNNARLFGSLAEEIRELIELHEWLAVGYDELCVLPLAEANPLANC